MAEYRRSLRDFRSTSQLLMTMGDKNSANDRLHTGLEQLRVSMSDLQVQQKEMCDNMFLMIDGMKDVGEALA